MWPTLRRVTLTLSLREALPYLVSQLLCFLPAQCLPPPQRTLGAHLPLSIQQIQLRDALFALILTVVVVAVKFTILVGLPLHQT